MVKCPNCQRKIAADLHIYSNERGFKKVTLGMQCNSCRTTYRGDDFLRVVRRVTASK